MIAKRVTRVVPSGIRKIFDRISQIKDPLDFSIGQPDFDVPEPIKEAACRAILQGKNRYTVTQGIPELREKIKAHLKKKTGVEPEAVLVTSGTSGAILLSMLVLCEKDDEVLIPDPYFILYRNDVELCGGVARYVDTYPDFRLKRDALEAAVTKKTRMLILNNPVNPTGVAYTADELRMVAGFARDHDLLVISDEIYDAYSYDFPHESMLKYYAKTVLVNGLSKTYAMPGWRLGYAAGPKEILDWMTTLQQFSYVCANTPSQYAGVAAFDVDMSPWIESYKRKRDLVYEGLKDCYEVVKPQGAFYIFPKCPWGTADEFVNEAISRRVLIVPGNACSRRDTHFRIAFAAPDETIKQGVEILRGMAKEGPARR